MASKNPIVRGVKQYVQKHVDLFDARGRKWVEKDPFRNDPPEWQGSGAHTATIGIIKEFWHLHWPYIAACRDLGVSYKLLDLSGPDWLEVALESGCDAFVARPSVVLSAWKQMYDERLRILALDMDKLVFPNYESLWIWESKRRMNYWLKAHGFPCPETSVFYGKEGALDFARSCPLPIVYKSDMGSGASGVIIFRDRAELSRHIKRLFQNGFRSYRRHKLDVEHRFVVLQEFLPDVEEWRIVRIGSSYFGYQKIMKGQFHSGSGTFGYGRPPEEMLDLAREITDHSGFTCLDVDLFRAGDGRLLVNELQAHFGQAGSREICRVDGQPGRMIRSSGGTAWEFEPGDFCQNFLCNQRILHVLELIEARQKVSNAG